jgi:hypothetical protein
MPKTERPRKILTMSSALRIASACLFLSTSALAQTTPANNPPALSPALPSDQVANLPGHGNGIVSHAPEAVASNLPGHGKNKVNHAPSKAVAHRTELPGHGTGIVDVH